MYKHSRQPPLDLYKVIYTFTGAGKEYIVYTKCTI